MKKIVLLACILLIPSFVFAGIFDKVKSVAGSVVSVVTGTTDPYQLSEEEFKEQCEKIEYEDLLRKAEENKGKFVKYDLCVYQKQGSYDYLAYGLLFFSMDGNKPIWLTDARNKVGSSLLAGDYATAYGICKGTKSVLLTTGYTEMPLIEILYVTVTK